MWLSVLLQNFKTFLFCLSQLDEVDRLWPSYGPSFISSTRADEPNPLDSIRADAVRRFYSGGAPFARERKEELVDLLGDTCFASPAHRTARIQSG